MHSLPALRTSCGTIFLLLVATLGFLPNMAAAISRSENEEIEEVFELDILGQKRPEQSAETVIERLKQLEDQRFSRVWYYYLSMTDDRYRDQLGLKQETIRRDINKIGDSALILRFLRQWANSVHEQGLSFEVVRQAYQEAVELCSQKPHREICGGIYQDFSIFLYEGNHIGESLKFAKMSHQILEKINPSRQIWLYRSKTLLAMLLQEAGLDKQAMFLRQEAYQWFKRDGYGDDASRTALSLAIANVNREPPDLSSARNYLVDAQEYAKDSSDERLIAQVKIIEGKLLILEGSEKEGEDVLVAAAKVLEKLQIYKFSSHAFIFAARSAWSRRDIDSTRKWLYLSKKHLQDEFNLETQFYHKLAAEVASKESRFEDEAKHLKKYLAAYQLQKDSEEDLQKIESSISLGLAVEEQKNIRLEQENQSHLEKIKAAEKITVLASLLSLCVIMTTLLWIKTWKQKQSIALREADMRTILDNVDEGLVMIERNQRINKAHSAKAPQLLGLEQLSDLSFSQDILMQFDINSEQQAILIEALHHCLGEDGIAFQLNEEHFIRELVVKKTGSILEARWFPILLKDQSLSRLLLCLRDVTETRKMAHALEREQKLKQQLPTKLRELLKAPRKQLGNFLGELNHLMRSHAGIVDKRSLKPSMHTLKGVARSLHLNGLSEGIHTWETESQNPERAEIAWQGLELVLGEYNLFWDILADPQQDSPEAKNYSVFVLLQELLPAFLQQLEDQPISWRALTIQEDWKHIDNADYKILREVLLHGVTNALDHGYLLPLKQGKGVSSIALDIQLLDDKEDRICIIRDQGVGIAREKLIQLAKEKGHELQTDTDISSYLLQEGVTTAQAVSKTSGRGVGLARIQELLNERGGRVLLRNRDDTQGACLQLTWPRTFKGNQGVGEADGASA